MLITFQGGVAGSTLSVSYLCKGLSEKGHNVVLACPQDSMYKDLLKDSKVKIEHLPFKSKWDKVTMRMIRDIVQRENIQIINAQASKDRYNTIFARWIYKLPVKLIHTRRQVSLSVGGLQSWFYTKGTDKIVAVSNGIKDSLVSKGIPKKHIKVIYNGTPTEKYEQIDKQKVEKLKSELGLKPDDFVIGCISRCKKQEQIIQTLQHIEIPVKVVFVGINSHDIENRIEPFCEPHTIHYCGHMEPKEAINYHKLFDIFILPSSSEGLSQSLLEAMYLGVPVIATNAAGNPDLVQHMENGLLFKDADIEGLAENIKLLMNDKALYQKLKENGEYTAQKKFSIENTIENYENFFYELIEQ